MKLPLRPAMLTAMSLDADFSDPTDLRDITAYQFLFYTGLRVGSITAGDHTVKFEDIYFHPSIERCEVVLVCIRSWRRSATGKFDMHLAKIPVASPQRSPIGLGCMAPAGRDAPTVAASNGARWRRTLECERTFVAAHFLHDGG